MIVDPKAISSIFLPITLIYVSIAVENSTKTTHSSILPLAFVDGAIRVHKHAITLDGICALQPLTLIDRSILQLEWLSLLFLPLWRLFLDSKHMIRSMYFQHFPD